MTNFVFGKGQTKLTFTINEKNEIRVSTLDSSIFNAGEKTFIDDMSVLCEVEISGRGNNKHGGDRHFSCSESVLLKYVSHQIESDEKSDILTVIQEDDVCRVESKFLIYKGTDTIRSWNIITNISDEPFTVEYISSLVLYGLIGKDIYNETNYYLPSNGWYSECQWKKNKLSNLGVLTFQDRKSMKKFCVSSTGSWSTKSYLPMGILENQSNSCAILWQIEANGSWTYELGDICRSVSLHLSGPSLQENGWYKRLNPNDSFETVKCAITFSNSIQGTIENITKYRRNIVWKSEYDKSMPTIFNEYMYASGNCPSIETIEQLAPMAQLAGVQYYVIDCGWHDEVVDPFYHVGRWAPSKLKYPKGFKEALDKIRSYGLKVGLWLEPEVVGTFGDASDFWDDDCFLKRFGKRIVSSSRYFLDYRNEKVINKMNKIIDDLVINYGVDYFKFDYNCDCGIGTDVNSDSLGDGLLEQNRAVIGWIKGIKERHPNLILECCCSGGNRMDYLSLSYSDMVSSSDQMNCYIYPYIVCNMLSAVLPEQAAVWSYPVCIKDETAITKELVAINMVNSLLGRMHLASKLYKLTKEQFNIVKEGVKFYDYIKQYKSVAVPYLPLGFCGDEDKVLSVGLKTEDKLFLFVYCLGTDLAEIPLPNGVKGIKVAFPIELATEFSVKQNDLVIKMPENNCARIFEIDL